MNPQTYIYIYIISGTQQEFYQYVRDNQVTKDIIYRRITKPNQLRGFDEINEIKVFFIGTYESLHNIEELKRLFASYKSCPLV